MSITTVKVKKHRRSRNGRNFDVKEYTRNYKRQTKIKPLPTKKGAVSSFGSEWEKNAAKSRENAINRKKQDDARIERDKLRFFEEMQKFDDKKLFDYAYGRTSRGISGHQREIAATILSKRGKLNSKASVHLENLVNAKNNNSEETTEEKPEPTQKIRKQKTTKAKIKSSILNLGELKHSIKEAREIAKRILEIE